MLGCFDLLVCFASIFFDPKKIIPFTQLNFFLSSSSASSSTTSSSTGYFFYIYIGFSHLANAPGSTGTVVALETTPAGVMHLHVAWLGDSKAILSTGGGFTVELTEDHRATNPKVKKNFKLTNLLLFLKPCTF